MSATGSIFSREGDAGQAALVAPGLAHDRDLRRIMRPEPDLGVRAGRHIGQRRAPGAGAEHGERRVLVIVPAS